MITRLHNSFQIWADKYARAHSGVVAVLPRGDWVEIEFKDGASRVCMTYSGVQSAISELA